MIPPPPPSPTINVDCFAVRVLCKHDFGNNIEPGGRGGAWGKDGGNMAANALGQKQAYGMHTKHKVLLNLWRQQYSDRSALFSTTRWRPLAMAKPMTASR